MELIARHREREERVHLERTDDGYRITVGETVYDVDVAVLGGGAHSLLIDGAQHEVVISRQGNGRYQVATATANEVVELADPLSHMAQVAHGRAGAGGPQRVTAYMPGRVVDILVEPGTAVEAGQGVLVLEAMKMKNEIQAEAAGTVTRILVEKGQAVEGGDPLFEIE